MLFRKYPLMDEAESGSTAGGAVGAAGGAAQGAGEPAEFSVSLALSSTSQTNEEIAAAAQTSALVGESQGWIDPTKGKVAFDKTGDAALDVALGFLAQNGYSHHHPAVQAAATGDFSLLAAELAAKGIAGWEQHVNLGKEAFERGKAQAQEQNDRIKTICLTHTNGDQALWDNTLSHWSANADPEEKAVINKALAAGDIVSEAVAHYMVHLFRNAPGVTVNPTQTVLRTGASTQSGGGAAPLSPLQYAQEVQKLAQRIGGSSLPESREYAALQARRAQYRG